MPYLSLSEQDPTNQINWRQKLQKPLKAWANYMRTQRKQAKAIQTDECGTVRFKV